MRGSKTLTPHLEYSPYRKKTIRIINNQPRNSHSSLLLKKSSILKFEDQILINNILFISKSINNLLPPIFNNWFIFCSNVHNYNAVSYLTDKLLKPSYTTDSYGKKTQLLKVLLIAGIKCKTFCRINLSNHSTKIKSKLFLLKDAKLYIY